MNELGSEQNILPPRKWKKRWAIALLAIVCLQLYHGEYTGTYFIHAPWWDTCLFSLSLAFAAWCVIRFFRGGYADKLVPNISTWGKWSLTFFLLPIFSSFSFWFSFTDLTDIITQITGTPFSISAFHFKEAESSCSDVCYTISAEDLLKHQLPSRIAIDFKPWTYYTYNSLPNPLPVVLKGKKSVFGFHFQCVTARQS